MVIAVAHTTSASVAWDAAGDFLRSRPVDHNVAMTILADRMIDSTPGHYWCLTDDGLVAGYAWLSPETYKAGVIPMERRLVEALADCVSVQVPDLSGIIGEAATAAAFAGRWTEQLGGGAEPDEGQRLYQLDGRQPRPMASGRADSARAEEVDTIVEMLLAFQDEVGGGGGGPPDLTAMVARRVADGRMYVWRDDDAVVGFAGSSEPQAGAVRVGPVYTRPDRRRAGYGAALTAAVGERALDAGAEVVLLYTQLSNPGSNRIYRRLGYRAVSEILSYRFAPPPHHPPLEPVP